MLLVLVLALTPAQIEQAIAHGQEMTFHEYAMRDDQGVFGLMTTPYSRVAGASFQAKSEYERFGPGDVPAELIEDEIRVLAVGTVKKVVIVPDGGAVVQPSAQEERSAGLLAVFPMEALPKSGEVRVIYAPGVERRWRFRDVR